MEQKVIDQAYRKYKSITNMSYSELLIWSKNKLSKTASLDRRPIKRNLTLLSKLKSQWTAKDVKEAKKVISYIARAKGIEREFKKNNKNDKSLTKNRIALRNWAFDVFK